MKKILSLVAVLALLLTAAWAENADMADRSQAVGSWYLSVLESEGMQFNPDDFGLSMVITLNADGTAELADDISGASMGTWSFDGIIVSILHDDESVDGVLADGELRVLDENTDVLMIFRREKSAMDVYLPADPRTDATLEDYQGFWQATLFDFAGMQLPMESVNLKMELEISGETANITSNESGEDESFTSPVTFDGGALTLTGKDSLPMRFELLQDGRLRYAEETEGETVAMYFESFVP